VNIDYLVNNDSKDLILFEPVHLYPEYYMPPEGFIDIDDIKTVKEKIDLYLSFDIWGLGVMLYEMMIEKEPFYNKNKTTPFNKSYQLKKDNFENLSPELCDLIEKMLETDNSKRLNIDQVIEHPWIKNFYLNKNSINETQ